MPFWRKKSDSRPLGVPPLQTQQSPPDLYGRPVTHSQPPPPPADNPFLQRGDELLNDGDYQNAVFMYSEAIRREPGNSLLYLKSSIARTMLNPPQWDQALQDVNTAIETNPSLGQAWKQKGDIYMRRGDFRSAEDTYLCAVGMLQGMERVQAQQGLADARSRNNMPTSTPLTPPTSPPAVTNNLPTRPRVPSTPTNAPSNPVLPTTPTAPVRQNDVPHTPSNIPSPPTVPSISVSPVTSAQPVRSPTLSPPSPAAGLASPTSPTANRTPSPSPYAHSEVLAQQLDIPPEAPPSYSASPRLSTVLGGNAGGATTLAQIATFKEALAVRKKGALYLRPYTSEGQIDAVQLLFDGKDYLQSILLDMPPAPPVHATWKKYNVNRISYPGNTFLDHDCESAASHEGYGNGTLSVSGYTEEYRECQLTLAPALNLFFEAQTIPPVMTIDKVVARLQTLQLQPDFEDNAKLGEVLGLTSLYSLTATRQTSIEDICMLFHRGQYIAPTRFVNFLNTGSFARHFLGAAGEGIGLTNFLFHIILGAELYIRLKNAGTAARYPNIMTDTTSALAVVSQLWMENVTIRVVPPPAGSRLGTPSKYTLISNFHTRQSEGLVRFAEALAWPYLDEARQNIENAYNNLIANTSSVNHFVKDWLYGLSLPGKYFRHRIMSCLVFCTPTIKHISSPPYYDNGIVVGNKSYWPKRTVLGRVLGGLRNPKSTCGWIGPVPAPVGFQTGYVLLHARRVNFVTPVVDNYAETNLEILGFSESEADVDPQGFVRDISDLTKWNPPVALPSRGTRSTTTNEATANVRLEAIRLTEVMVSGVAATPNTKQYRASLDFLNHGARVTFTLYSNPTFVHVPKCEGSSHPIHERLVRKHFSNLILAKDLKTAAGPVVAPSVETLTIIDATEPGEEAMARAWCAESGRHAVVRRPGIGCFTCATALTQKRTGLGFSLLIWC